LTPPGKDYPHDPEPILRGAVAAVAATKSQPPRAREKTNMSTSESVIYHGPDPDYCGTCYGAARKHGRKVSLTTIYPYPVCGQCEQHLRNGLVHYTPSNGSEFAYFYDRCGMCRHYIEDPDDPKPGNLAKPFTGCAWGVLDRVIHQMGTEEDHIDRWFDPADLLTTTDEGAPISPPRCVRFTYKGDDGGEHRDPPKPDCEGQLFFGEVLTVPERVPAKAEASL
jgi:hypothetical protein